MIGEKIIQEIKISKKDADTFKKSGREENMIERQAMLLLKKQRKQHIRIWEKMIKKYKIKPSTDNSSLVFRKDRIEETENQYERPYTELMTSVVVALINKAAQLKDPIDLRRYDIDVVQ